MKKSNKAPAWKKKKFNKWTRQRNGFVSRSTSARHPCSIPRCPSPPPPCWHLVPEQITRSFHVAHFSSFEINLIQFVSRKWVDGCLQRTPNPRIPWIHSRNVFEWMNGIHVDCWCIASVLSIIIIYLWFKRKLLSSFSTVHQLTDESFSSWMNLVQLIVVDNLSC